MSEMKIKMQPGINNSCRFDLSFDITPSGQTIPMVDGINNVNITMSYAPYTPTRVISDDGIVQICRQIDLRDTLRDVLTAAIAELDGYYAKRGAQS